MAELREPEFTKAADDCLRLNALVEFFVGGKKFIAAPDVVMMDGVANGHEIPDTAKFTRLSDQRTVYFFDGE